MIACRYWVALCMLFSSACFAADTHSFPYKFARKQYKIQVHVDDAGTPSDKTTFSVDVTDKEGKILCEKVELKSDSFEIPDPEKNEGFYTLPSECGVNLTVVRRPVVNYRSSSMPNRDTRVHIKYDELYIDFMDDSHNIVIGDNLISLHQGTTKIQYYK